LIGKDEKNVFDKNTIKLENVKETVYRRNIACGGGSSVTGPLAAFNEDGK
jgi:hypothetical protein